MPRDANYSLSVSLVKITRQRLMADLQRVPIQSPMLECGSAAESGAPVGMVRSVAHEEAMVMLPRLPPSALTGVGLGDPAFQPGVHSLDMDGRFPANYRASASVSAGINEQSQHYAPNLPRPRLANSASTGNLDALVAPPYHEQEYRAENRSFGRINIQSAHFRPEHTGHARYQHEYAARPSFMPSHPAMYSNESTVSNGHADLQMHQFQESPTVPLWQSMQTMSLRGDYTAGNAPKLISRQPAPQLVRHHSAESIAPSMNYHLHGQSFGTNSRSFRRQADGDGESQHRFANGHQMHLHDSMPHQMYMQPPMVQSHSANDSCRDFPPSLASHTTLSWRDTQMTGGFARPSPLVSPVMCPSRSMPPMASGSPRSHRHYAQSLSRPSSAASSHPPLDTPIVPRGQMLAMSRTQQGCRALQKLLDESAEHVVVVSALMLDELIGYFAALMTDPFGNYLAQKLIERCSRDDCQRIVMETANALPRIAMDSHGTRSVQRLVEQVRTNEQVYSLTTLLLHFANVPSITLVPQIIAVCESISPHVSRLIVDPNATHVIQKCLVHIPPRYLHFIFNAVAGDFVEVCRDRHGCCVAQRCMDHGEPEIVESLMHAVCTNVPKLIQVRGCTCVFVYECMNVNSCGV